MAGDSVSDRPGGGSAGKMPEIGEGRDNAPVFDEEGRRLLVDFIILLDRMDRANADRERKVA